MPSSLLKKIGTAIDYYTGRYECVVADKKLTEECLAIRAAVFGGELKRKKADHASPADKDEFDDASIHLACLDTKKNVCIGGLRITPLSAFAGDGGHLKEYHAAHFPSELHPRVCVTARLAVLKEYRATPAALLLALKAYEQALTRMGMVLSVIVCEPNLYPMYLRLGYRPLDRIFNSHLGGYRLPLFMVVQDYEQLRVSKSPFLQVAAKAGFPVDAAGLHWLQDFREEHPVIDTGYRLLGDEDGEDWQACLLQDLSAAGKNELLKNAITMTCGVGEKVIAEGDGGKNLGLIVKGALEVRKDDKVLAILGPGETFGEMAFILNEPRSADVIAALPDTEVILMSLSSLNRLSQPEDKTKVWQNLARLLARRLMGRNAKAEDES